MLNVHKIINNSSVYGPGNRTVIWFKGCSIRCQGCINPKLWDCSIEQLFTTEQLVDQIQNDEVTLLGGEPLEQSDITTFIEALKKRKIGIVLFTGYSLSNKKINDIAKLCDMVISEPFEIAQVNPNLYLRGSDNQVITLFSTRYNNTPLFDRESYELIINEQIEVRGRDKNFLEKLLK